MGDYLFHVQNCGSVSCADVLCVYAVVYSPQGTAILQAHISALKALLVQYKTFQNFF